MLNGAQSTATNGLVLIQCPRTTTNGRQALDMLAELLRLYDSPLAHRLMELASAHQDLVQRRVNQLMAPMPAEVADLLHLALHLLCALDLRHLVHRHMDPMLVDPCPRVTRPVETDDKDLLVCVPDRARPSAAPLRQGIRDLHRSVIRKTDLLRVVLTCVDVSLALMYADQTRMPLGRTCPTIVVATAEDLATALRHEMDPLRLPPVVLHCH